MYTWLRHLKISIPGILGLCLIFLSNRAGRSGEANEANVVAGAEQLTIFYTGNVHGELDPCG